MAPTEAKAAAELRGLVSHLLTPYYDTPFNFVRWIQGYPGVPIKEVAKKLTTHLQFRKCTWEPDSYVTRGRGFHPVHNHWMRGITGMSGVLENVIVNVEQCCMDYEGMLNQYSMVEIMKARLFDLEEFQAEVMKLEKETGKQASVLYVLDTADLVYTKKLVDLILVEFRCLLEFMAEHYVELFKYFLVVNVPSWLYTVWLMLKPLLPERTRNKMTSKWRDEIAEYAQHSSCPTFWCDDTHKNFSAVLDRPPRFPPMENPPETPDRTDKLSIKAGAVEWFEMELKKGDRLHWYLSSTAHFGVAVLKDAGDGEEDPTLMQQVFPIAPWIPPTKVPIEEGIVVPESGNYKIWLSNSRAWWHTLHLTFKITLSRDGEEPMAIKYADCRSAMRKLSKGDRKRTVI